MPTNIANNAITNAHYDRAQSGFRALHTGLPQGAVSSCLLFGVYVEDLICPLIEENTEILIKRLRGECHCSNVLRGLTQPRLFLLPIGPLIKACNDLSHCPTYFDLFESSFKDSGLYCSFLLSTSMETIYNNFPSDAWLHIYKLDINGVTGAGIFCGHFSHYLPLGTDKTPLDGEVDAIKVALTHLNICPFLFE
ncbi:hypothetical protein CEXT_683691 [Caerostris extrusa]|uniref:Reverse transcriptase domain-containing protein n=1 Tax=Caerostris extrusa TaxID=172846 RepID=A0AAV4Q450_CAEEX|nr:hypothetical protein CEXT_683691 [Caerostris extrusa]